MPESDIRERFRAHPGGLVFVLDPHLAGRREIEPRRLRGRTVRALLRVASLVADGMEDATEGAEADGRPGGPVGSGGG